MMEVVWWLAIRTRSGLKVKQSIAELKYMMQYAMYGSGGIAEVALKGGQ